MLTLGSSIVKSVGLHSVEEHDNGEGWRVDVEVVLKALGVLGKAYILKPSESWLWIRLICVRDLRLGPTAQGA